MSLSSTSVTVAKVTWGTVPRCGVVLTLSKILLPEIGILKPGVNCQEKIDRDCFSCSSCNCGFVCLSRLEGL